MRQVLAVGAVIALALLISIPSFSDPQVSKTVTLTTGTASRVASTRTMVSSLSIQMAVGGANPGYVLWAPPGTTCSKTTEGHVIAELAPASAAGPGGQFVMSPAYGADPAGFDAQYYCVEGTTADTVRVSYNVRN